jgi:quercetin dioxygenase-like cupin family protein
VIFVHQGQCRVQVEGEFRELGEGDTFTTPIGAPRSFANDGANTCVLYVTRRGDQPQAPQFKG